MAQYNNKSNLTVYPSVLSIVYFSAAIQCKPLDVIANGNITYSADITSDYDFGTEATYTCNEGFFLDLSVGVRVRTCVDDDGIDAVGMFTDEAPVCVRKSTS